MSTQPAGAEPPQHPRGSVPPLLAQLLDDAAVFPPGNAALPEAVTAHRTYRRAWYADLVGPLLVPASDLPELVRLADPGEGLEVGLIADTGIDAIADAKSMLVAAGVRPRQVEAAMARRGEDPVPTLKRFLELLKQHQLAGFAEIPLAWGLLSALDAVAEARSGGVEISAKFRTGGLAAELFPTPVELAAVIEACVQRQVPFKLTAGLHNAIRHTDPETGFTHHGFLNVLVATCAAADGAEVAEVAGLLATTQPLTLIEATRPRLRQPRPLWRGFGTCSIPEPLLDLQQLNLLSSLA